MWEYCDLMVASQVANLLLSFVLRVDWLPHLSQIRVELHELLYIHHTKVDHLSGHNKHTSFPTPLNHKSMTKEHLTDRQHLTDKYVGNSSDIEKNWWERTQSVRLH